ncbi:hypothetical protein [Marinomonas atlantica]|uniref:hypothetical protein n=1 Tax=Marinomonas atlantica TaxID=1806668 RepID=UPI00082C441E|nr:hypothetical protein [Marinomonas atlantica]
MATYKTASLNEVASAIAQTLDGHVMQPTKFRPNIGKCQIHFGKKGTDKEGLIAVKVELVGNFGAEFELKQEELTRDFTGSLQIMLNELNQAHGAAEYRRNHERNIINTRFAGLKH